MLKIFQRTKYWLLAIFLTLSLGVFTKNILQKSPSSQVDLVSYPNFYDNPYLDDKMRTSMAPYLLPLNHPTKPLLDSLFSKYRITENKQSLLDAGFEIIAAMSYSYIIVAKHPEIKGYVLKLYLDTETNTKKDTPHWEWLIKRCKGAENIRKSIKENKLTRFVVPDKWLYILPVNPASKEHKQEPMLVIETEMKLKSEKVSAKAWKTKITPQHLDELYTIFKTGFGTTGLDRNVLITKKGVFAFADTEYPDKLFDLKKVKPYLSEEMQLYWENLCEREKLAGK